MANFGSETLRKQFDRTNLLASSAALRFDVKRREIEGTIGLRFSRNFYRSGIAYCDDEFRLRYFFVRRNPRIDWDSWQEEPFVFYKDKLRILVVRRQEDRQNTTNQSLENRAGDGELKLDERLPLCILYSTGEFTPPSRPPRGLFTKGEAVSGRKSRRPGKNRCLAICTEHKKRPPRLCRSRYELDPSPILGSFLTLTLTFASAIARKPFTVTIDNL